MNSDSSLQFACLALWFETLAVEAFIAITALLRTLQYFTVKTGATKAQNFLNQQVKC